MTPPLLRLDKQSVLSGLKFSTSGRRDSAFLAPAGLWADFDATVGGAVGACRCLCAAFLPLTEGGGVLYLRYDCNPTHPALSARRSPSWRPCRSPLALSYSSCLSGVAGDQRHATGAEQEPVCERASERDNHTFYMLHLPLTGVALRLGAKCDLDGEIY